MNHFIFSEFLGVFSFTHDYMANILQFLKFYFVCLVITFSVSVTPITVMVPGNCCFYVYCVNVHFRRKKWFEKFTIALLLLNKMIIFLKFPAIIIYLFKGSNRNTRKSCQICSKLTVKIPERRYLSASIVAFEQVNFYWVSEH